MQLKHFFVVAVLGTASAQNATQNLNATLAGNPNTANLTTLLGQFPNLVSQLDGATNITILAPSNNAISNFLNTSIGTQLATNPGLVQALLQYHVLNGTYSASTITNTSFIPTALTNSSYTNVTGGQVVEAMKAGNSTAFFSGLFQNTSITQANINFTGGIIHVVDRVLNIPENVSTTGLAANLTSFTGALNISNLLDTVDSTSDVTVFAPNNNAFQAIGSALANLTTQDIARILNYHVINGTVGYSTVLMNGTNFTTMGGNNLTVYIQNGTIFVNSARVVTPNILVANGVVHIVDEVLNPNSTVASPTPSATSGAIAFPSASSASNVPFTSGEPTATTSLAAPAATPTSSKGAAAPMNTGAMGAAALFGAGAALLNY